MHHIPWHIIGVVYVLTAVLTGGSWLRYQAKNRWLSEIPKTRDETDSEYWERLSAARESVRRWQNRFYFCFMLLIIGSGAVGLLALQQFDVISLW